jgi:hypothetical protein
MRTTADRAHGCAVRAATEAAARAICDMPTDFLFATDLLLLRLRRIARDVRVPHEHHPFRHGRPGRHGARPHRADLPGRARTGSGRRLFSWPGRLFGGAGRSTSARWRSARRRSAPSIPIRRRASTTSPSCFRTRATLRRRGARRSPHVCDKSPAPLLGGAHPARVEPKIAPQESEKTGNFKPLVFRQFQAGVDTPKHRKSHETLAIRRLVGAAFRDHRRREIAAACIGVHRASEGRLSVIASDHMDMGRRLASLRRRSASPLALPGAVTAWRYDGEAAV